MALQMYGVVWEFKNRMAWQHACLHHCVARIPWMGTENS